MAQISFFSVALKNLKRKTFRTGVLVFAIALLVALLIFAISFTVSVASSLKKSSERLGADLVVVPVGARGFAEEFLLESKNTSFYMPMSIIEKVKKIEGIESLTYHTYLSSISGLCCDIMPTRIVAYNPETDFIINPWLQKSLGRPLQLGEAIAGSGTSENLGLGLLDIEATIFNNRFKIVGVLEQTGTGLDHALFMTEENLKNIIESGKSPLKKGQISIIFTKLKKGYDPDFVGRVLEGEIPEVDVVARSNMGEKFINTLADINKIFLLTTILASVLTTFLVWAIFSAIANERSKEIGRAGPRRQRVPHCQALSYRSSGTGSFGLLNWCIDRYVPFNNAGRIVQSAEKHLCRPYGRSANCNRPGGSSGWDLHLCNRCHDAHQQNQKT